MGYEVVDSGYLKKEKKNKCICTHRSVAKKEQKMENGYGEQEKENNAVACNLIQLVR